MFKKRKTPSGTGIVSGGSTGGKTLVQSADNSEDDEELVRIDRNKAKASRARTRLIGESDEGNAFAPVALVQTNVSLVSDQEEGGDSNPYTLQAIAALKARTRYESDRPTDTAELILTGEEAERLADSHGDEPEREGEAYGPTMTSRGSKLGDGEIDIETLRSEQAKVIDALSDASSSMASDDEDVAAPTSTHSRSSGHESSLRDILESFETIRTKLASKEMELLSKGGQGAHIHSEGREDLPLLLMEATREASEMDSLNTFVKALVAMLKIKVAQLNLNHSAETIFDDVKESFASMSSAASRIKHWLEKRNFNSASLRKVSPLLAGFIIIEAYRSNIAEGDIDNFLLNHEILGSELSSWQNVDPQIESEIFANIRMRLKKTYASETVSSSYDADARD